MNFIRLTLVLLSGLLAAGALHAQPASSPDAVINRLAESLMTTALQAVGESGSVYPFALQWHAGEDEVELLGYRGEADQAPPSDQWALALQQRLQQQAATDPTLMAAGLVRMSEVKTEQGETLPGLWALVDHRDGRPVVLFLPFLANPQGGKRVPGEVIYHAPQQGLFDAQRQAR